MVKAKGRAQQFQDDEHIAKDYDPEANAPDEQGSGSDVSDDEKLQTEHYVTVGKSKLREKEGVSLGAQYRGARVNRKALEEESDEEEISMESDDDEQYDDPETADLAADEAAADDSEIDSDDALGESDAERFEGFAFRGSSKPKTLAKNANAKRINKRATASDFMSNSEDEDDEDASGAALDQSDEDDDESDEDEDMDDGLDALVDGDGFSDEDESDSDGLEDDDDENEEGGSGSDSDDDGSKKTSRALDAKPHLAASSNRPDVEKGIAIQQQRRAYDALLNLRIRLQKALIAANTFSALEDASDGESEPYEAAEEAAVKLLNTISSLRHNIDPISQVGDKRRRDVAASMSSDAIWDRLQEEERAAKAPRGERLEKWSRKVESVNVATTQRALGAKKSTLVNALQEQLAQPENRLVKRTRVPRSCAPAQAAKKITEDEQIFDDADFYQLLLKELVGQRTVETDAAQAGAISSVMLIAAKEAKNRKVVDRKASKGRKMRFTVHEKLQNFMAPEFRGSWEKEAADRLFGTLFGRKLQLNEDESEDDEVEGLNAEEEGLRLFRN